MNDQRVKRDPFAGGIWKERLDATAVVFCRIIGYGGILRAMTMSGDEIHEALVLIAAVGFIINANLIRLRMRD